MSINAEIQGMYAERLRLWSILDPDYWTADAVRVFQRVHGLEEDGIIGPMTFQRIVLSAIHSATGPALAITRALDAWLTRIEDPTDARGTPESRKVWAGLIESFIRRGLLWNVPYHRDGDFAWCGAFVAWAWESLDPAVRRGYMASTYRLACLGEGRAWDEGKRPPPLTMPMRLTGLAKPGDVITVGHYDDTRGPATHGTHIAMVLAHRPPIYTTIEGNAWGWHPDGQYRQGVVVRDRMASDIVHTIALGDLPGNWPVGFAGGRP